VVMGPGQNFLTQVGSGQPFMVWVWILKISYRNVKFFNFFPSGQKKSLRVGSEISRVNGGWPHIYCGSKVSSGQGSSLLCCGSWWFHIFSWGHSSKSFISIFVQNLFCWASWKLGHDIRPTIPIFSFHFVEAIRKQQKGQGLKKKGKLLKEFKAESWRKVGWKDVVSWMGEYKYKDGGENHAWKTNSWK